MKAVRAIIAAVADLLRVGPVPIARGRVIVNLDTTPVQLHTTLVLVWCDGVARIAGSSRIARTAR